MLRFKYSFVNFECFEFTYIYLTQFHLCPSILPLSLSVSELKAVEIGFLYSDFFFNGCIAFGYFD